MSFTVIFKMYTGALRFIKMLTFCFLVTMQVPITNTGYILKVLRIVFIKLYFLDVFDRIVYKSHTCTAFSKKGKSITIIQQLKISEKG